MVAPLIKRLELIISKQITAINLVYHIAKVGSHAVGHNHIGLLLKLRQVVHHPGVEESRLFQSGFIHDHFHTLGFDALHDALDAAAAVVITARLHHQAVNTDYFGVTLQYLGCAKIFASGVAVHNGAHDVLGHGAVVGQQLFGVFGQAVAAVAKAGVVVVAADAGVQADAFNDLPGVQPVAGGVGV